MLSEKIQNLKVQAQEELKKASTSKELYEVKVNYLGKKGQISLLMREMGQLSKEERPAFGQSVNDAKSELESLYEEREKELKSREMSDKLAGEFLDLTLPGPFRHKGSCHPITRVISEMVEILGRLGYSVRSGPLIEKDFYNFEALNVPEDHPARDMQDTFYVDDEYVLRTHTSPIQIRTLENEEPPLRILAPGSVFRCDSDVSHSPNFHQMEGMLVDRQVSMADLKGTIAFFVKEFFGSRMKIRFRPSFFPFTEPSAEVDCSCPICSGKGCRMCSQTGWVEIGGSGLVNPKVFEKAGVDPDQWQGFAFGFGIERMAIIKYGIEDIRLFAENNTKFLEQF